eukprot:m.169119 g.169119  ORF g.169119 m.169119 type:complete len:81 (+) comp14764_c0_seq6:1540-1782(+)
MQTWCGDEGPAVVEPGQQRVWWEVPRPERGQCGTVRGGSGHRGLPASAHASTLRTSIVRETVREGLFWNDVTGSSVNLEN